MIPENKIEAVQNALVSLFKTHQIDDIQQITVGLTSALVFRIVVKGAPYLLRIITRTDTMADPTNGYACMSAAASIGIAPKVWYASAEERFSITDFIEAKPFSIDEARLKLPGVLRQLHTLTGFPASPVMNAFGMAATFIPKFQALKLMPESETKEIFAQFEHIAKIYPRESDAPVSCHNDLKPENIVYDGEKPWIVDWESAFVNHRYADLSIVTNFVNRNEAEERDFLQRYLGHEPTEFDMACFYLLQQVVHINYFTVFMVILASTGKPLDFKNIPDMDYREFHDRMWNGEITLVNDEPRLQYALLHKQEAEKNMRSQRFKNAVAVVSKLK